MKVLYVQGNEHEQRHLSTEIGEAALKVTVDIVHTQAEAIERLADSHGEYALLFAELGLADGDGMALLAHVHERALPLAVVLLTDSRDEEAVVDALDAGADGCVVKDPGYAAGLPGILEDALARFLERRATRQPIAEHGRAAKALRESDELSRNVLDNAPVGIYRTTPDGQILVCNPALARMLGYDSIEERQQVNLEQGKGGSGSQCTVFRQLIRQLLPRPVRAVAKQIMRLASPWKAIVAPLIVEDAVVGLLSVQGTDLQARDSPAVTALAYQVAAAWRRAQLFEQAQDEIAERVRAEQALRASEQEAHVFQERLMALHQVSVELAKAQDLDELYRYAIELGRSQLGFDRLGLWMVSEDQQRLTGTFGTDERGEHREIDQHPLRDRLRSQSRVVINEGDAALWHLMASLWDGQRSIGWLSADSALCEQPLAPHQSELLSLSGSMVAQLIRRCSISVPSARLRSTC